MTKYLLCRPLGGLNDLLCQVYNCYGYCLRNNRTLMIDTEYNSFFRKSFDEYFTFNDKIVIPIIYNSTEIKNIIENNNFTTFPEYIKDKVFNYKVHWVISDRFIVGTDIKPKIDLNKVYDEDLILYHSEGGGEGSLEIMKYLKINHNIINEFYLRYNQITKPYVSLHIRNTDYQTNYIELYLKNKDKLVDKNIFLATDSLEVQNFFKNENLKIFIFTKLPEKNIPIHDYYNGIDKHAVMVDTLCDLLILSLADSFILPDKYYGFTKLAYNLFSNKDIVHKIINSE